MQSNTSERDHYQLHYDEDWICISFLYCSISCIFRNAFNAYRRITLHFLISWLKKDRSIYMLSLNIKYDSKYNQWYNVSLYGHMISIFHKELANKKYEFISSKTNFIWEVSSSKRKFLTKTSEPYLKPQLTP